MKGSKIWGVGKHHLYINKEPRWVYVSKEALQKDYEILKANLPIPIGIDHLDPKIIQENKILQKMDLLNVGSISDVELKDDGIHILEARITNPLVQELYDTKQLPSWSIVSKVALDDCKSNKVDYVEEYSIINRVDFVEKGACTTCNLEYEDDLMNAKSVIGDIMTEEGNEQNNGEDETTLNDVVEAITGFKEETNSKLEAMDDRIKDLEKNNTTNDGDEVDGEGENPEMKAMQKEIDTMKAEAAQMEAKNIIQGLIKEGKILPKQIDQHMKLALNNKEAYTDMMAEAPVLVDIDKRFSKGEGKNPEDEDDKNLSKYEKENDINIEEMIAEEAEE